MLSLKVWTPVWVIVSMAVFLSPARSGEPTAEDAAFARNLLRRGFPDLAETVFRRISEKADHSDLQARGERGLIDVLRYQAEKERDPGRKKRLFDEAIRRYRSFLADRKDPLALFYLAELLKAKGLDFTREIKRTGKGKKEALQKEAVSAFREAIALLQEYLESLQKEMKNQEIDSLPPEDRERYRIAKFTRAELHFHMAQVYDGAGEKRGDWLRKADALFHAFQWDDEDSALAYLAYILRGRIAQELKDFGKAIDFYNIVLRLPEPEEAGPKAKRMRDRLRIMAYHRILEALVLAGKPDQVDAVAKAMEREYPDCIEDRFVDPLSGRAAVLEKAKALQARGKLNEAMREVARVVEKGGAMMESGLALLGGWGLGTGAGVEVSLLLLQAEGLARSGKGKKAVEAYENAIARLQTAEDWKAYGVQAWAGLGAVYAARSMMIEAGLAYQKGDQVAQRFLQGKARSAFRTDRMRQIWDLGARCAYHAYLAFKDVWRQGKEGNEIRRESLKARWVKQRNRLVTTYPDSEFATHLWYFTGRDLLRAGNLREAIEAFQRLEKTSMYYPAACTGIGQAYFKIFEKERAGLPKGKPSSRPGEKAATPVPSPRLSGHLTRAEGAFREGLEAVSRRGEDTVLSPAKLKEVRACAVFYLGRIAKERADWAGVVDTLRGFEETHEEMPQLILPSAFIRLLAYIRMGDPRGVEEMVRVMEGVDERLAEKEGREMPHGTVLAGYRFAGRFFAGQADRFRERDPEAREEAARKAAEYLWLWVEGDLFPNLGKVAPDRGVQDLEAVGACLFKAGDVSKALRCYKTILKQWGRRLNGGKRSRFQRALGECHIRLNQWGEALDLFQRIYDAEKSESLAEKLVQIRMELGDRSLLAGEPAKGHLHYDEALKLFALLLGKKDLPNSVRWWRWKFDVWRILFKKGRFKEIVNQIENAKGQYPSLGGPDLRARILDLQDKAKELAGTRLPKKRKPK
ncbi:MAG: tetratricopeptide repeat protein [Planctomycetota bacterium]